jgi:mannose-6-phosphate isomerase-like protein (cupin superfamily)
MLKAPAVKDKPTRIVGDKTGTMERVLADGLSPPGKPSFFKMRAPIPAQGNDRTLMAATDRVWLFLNTYAENDGENLLHTHTNEDHSFVVLQGRARFFGPGGEAQEIGVNEGIMLPRGTFYTFKAVGGPLVMLRVGAVVDAAKNAFTRTLQDGRAVHGNSKDNNAVDCVFSDQVFG